MTRPQWIAVLILTTAAAGCADSTRPAPPAGNAPSNGDAAANADAVPLAARVWSVHQGSPITDEEALALGREMEAAIANGDTAAFTALFDWDAFGEIAVGFLPAGTDGEKAFRAGVFEGFRSSADRLGAHLGQELSKGSYVLLHCRPTDDGQRLIFRALRADGGLNYHEVCLARRGGEPRAVDIYVHLSGERLSETMQRMILSMTPPPDASILSRLRGPDRELIANLQTLKDMTQAVRAGESAQALELYRALPERLQRTKAILLIRLMAAQRLGEEEQLAAVDAFRESFPDDPSLHLLSLDALVLRKQFSEAHQTLTRLDEAVGGDPYLVGVRGNLYVMEGKFDQAETIATLLLASDPRDLGAHWLQASIALAKKDHPRTAELLTKIRDELGVPLSDLGQLPEYADFVNSPEYEKWSQAAQK